MLGLLVRGRVSSMRVVSRVIGFGLSFMGLFLKVGGECCVGVDFWYYGWC